MFLRSLTIKGFKSFAESANIDLSPGVSVIVGPNGSGKSNIVDAIAWVLGAQGPKTVRSTKMDDVIFAGTGKRGALGRAEVSITIDNSDHRLGIDLADVMITRTLFRSGESEYALNGNPCRLLDLQDLLSDAGVGRQQHVIISQGQLDTVLNARPEERRGIVEEAAGITKFKKRRERTEKRLEAMEVDLSRAGDLLREVRRQVRPLAQQAQKAKRQLELRDRTTQLRRYLAGSEVRALEDLAEKVAQDQVDAELAVLELQTQMSEIDKVIYALEMVVPPVNGDDLVDLISRAETLSERFKAAKNISQEKKTAILLQLRTLDRTSVLESLRNEQQQLTGELHNIEHDIVQLGPELESLESDETAFKADETPDIAEKLSILTESSNVLRQRLGSLSLRRSSLVESCNRLLSEEHHLYDRRLGLSAQNEQKNKELDEVNVRLADMAGRIAKKQEEFTHAEERELQLKLELEDLQRRHSELELSVGTLSARVAAYEAAIEEGRSKTQAKSLAQIKGSIGALVDLIDIAPGYEGAFTASVRGISDAVLAESSESAADGLRHLKRQSLEGSIISITGYLPTIPVMPQAREITLETMRSAVSTSKKEVGEFLDVVLASTYVVSGSLDEAIEFHLRYPKLTFVTLEGERIGPNGFHTAIRPMQATGIALERARIEVDGLNEQFRSSKVNVDRVKNEHQSWTETLRALRSELESLREDFARSESLPGRIRSELIVTKSQLVQLEAEYSGVVGRQAESSSEIAGLEPQIDELQAQLESTETQVALLQSKMQGQYVKRRELDAKRSDLEVKAATLEQRRLGISRALESIAGRLEVETANQVEASREVSSGKRSLVGLDYLIGLCSACLSDSLELIKHLRWLRSELVGEAQGRLNRLSEARANRTECERNLNAKREALQLAAIRSSETRIRLETMGERIRRELGIETEIAKSTPVPEGVSPTHAEAVLAELEGELASLGAVNELAEVELAELSERARFLESQLEDVKSSRREIVKVIKAIDDEMLTVFAEAFNDVSENFATLFQQLFPGGKGKLILGDPDQPFGSGLEIEVVLPGKNVKRLSLLSGGERSLVALAFLFAVFESRPSPFYILDEVEAALDDINLNRFLGLISSFGKKAQLLIISHQKRTMEVADLLYGVTMQEGGSTKVIAQRMSDIYIGA